MSRGDNETCLKRAVLLTIAILALPDKDVCRSLGNFGGGDIHQTKETTPTRWPPISPTPSPRQLAVAVRDVSRPILAFSEFGDDDAEGEQALVDESPLLPALLLRGRFFRARQIDEVELGYTNFDGSIALRGRGVREFRWE